jgi:ABC-type Mn2+/Zn2+ transport system ATPase subunit
MFSDPLNVNISCFKETKKGEKPKIELEIFYKGNETDIGNLSGGEFDRLNMCFLLSFNELSRSNIIILDEALSSLNQELVCDIIEHLKENKEKEKLIIMTLHQSIKGMFDQVINL